MQNGRVVVEVLEIQQMVYTDGTHLTADSLDELYEYAIKVGLNPDWIDFMGRTIHPHFDICGHVKRRVLADEKVQKVSCREIIKLCIAKFRLPEDTRSAEEDGSLKKDLPALQLPSEMDYKRLIDGIFKRTGISR